MRFRIPIAFGGVLVMMTMALGGGTAASAAPAAKTAGIGTNAVQNYTIFVHTANIDGAGTDATVRMKVYGTLAESPGYVNLDNSADNFERNSNDYFGPFSWYDIGRPDFIGVYKGSNGSEWYPEYAQVYAHATGTWYHCPMNAYYGDGEETRWFDCP
ncbi:PLAT/LH2 domain-containing protein [Micromonospora sp. NBC_01405]|uniref:PLAT/LH2 domain-containing protein n=1 Tax=Micromonospora sp. NBC_01405 TaxID=2903589 RepID=UPI003243C0FD